MTDIEPSHVGPYTWDDFIALEEDDLRELIDGELVEVEVPGPVHEEIVANVIYFLVGWARSNGGRTLGSGYKIRISERRGLMPDLQFYRAGNNIPPTEHGGLVTGTPDLVVEIISPSSSKYDRVKKLNWYAGRGIAEYWLIDPREHTAQRLVLRDGSYMIATSLAEDDVLRPETFPGLEIPLAEIWPGAESPSAI